MDQNILLLLIALMVILLLCTVLALIVYSGLLSEVTVGVGAPPISDAVVYYKFGKGYYRDIMGSGYIFTEVTSIAPKKKCFGVYYDNPDRVQSENLRWAVGVIVKDEKDREIDPAILEKLQQEGYKEFKFPRVENAVKADFPCKTQISVLLGMYKVYPKLDHYVKEKKLCAHPWLEIYDGEIVHFMAPLSKQESFYVPETIADEQESLKATNETTSKKQPRSVQEGDTAEQGDNRDFSAEKWKDSVEISPKQPLKFVGSEKRVVAESRSKSVHVANSSHKVVLTEKNRSCSISTIMGNGEHKGKSVNVVGEGNQEHQSKTGGSDSLFDSSTGSVESMADTTMSTYHSSEMSYASDLSQNTSHFSDSAMIEENNSALKHKNISNEEIVKPESKM